MTNRFLRYFDWLMPRECHFKKGHWGDMDYVTWEDVTGDAGGLTKYGIDQRSHPKTDIKALTLEQAREIYWLEYWAPSAAEVMPEGYGEVLCDIRVNGGNGPLMLQQALNQHGAGLTEDGRIGPKTLAAMQEHGEDGLAGLIQIRQARYERLARKPALKKFLAGWTNRNRDLAEFVGLHAA